MIYSAVSVQQTNVIFKCQNKACKHIWTKQYRKFYRQAGYTAWSQTTGKPYTIQSVYEYKREQDGKVLSMQEDHTCPECGRRGKANIVHGTYNREKKCDGRCMSAKGGDCECSCGGANHGINHA